MILIPQNLKPLKFLMHTTKMTIVRLWVTLKRRIVFKIITTMNNKTPYVYKKCVIANTQCGWILLMTIRIEMTDNFFDESVFMFLNTKLNCLILTCTVAVK